MKNLNLIKLALTFTIFAQSAALLAMEEPSKAETTTAAKSFFADHKTAVIGGTVAGLGLLTAGSAIAYKLLAKPAVKKTSVLKPVLACAAIGAATVLVAAIIYGYKNSGKVSGAFNRFKSLFGKKAATDEEVVFEEDITEKDAKTYWNYQALMNRYNYKTINKTKNYIEYESKNAPYKETPVKETPANEDLCINTLFAE